MKEIGYCRQDCSVVGQTYKKLLIHFKTQLDSTSYTRKWNVRPQMHDHAFRSFLILHYGPCSLSAPYINKWYSWSLHKTAHTWGEGKYNNKISFAHTFSILLLLSCFSHLLPLGPPWGCFRSRLSIGVSAEVTSSHDSLHCLWGLNSLPHLRSNVRMVI